MPKDVGYLNRHECASVLLLDEFEMPDEELKTLSVLGRNGLFHLD